jgi:tetratricopeptide (TPR) repeat protein
MRGWFGYWEVLYSALHMVGEHREALDAGKRACRQYPDHAGSCLRWQAVELAALGRIRQMNEIVAQMEVLPQTAAVPLALIQLVETLHAHGRHETANNVVDRAIVWFEGRPPQEAETWNHRFWYGKALYLADRRDEAQAVFDALVEEFPQSVDARGARGFVAAVRGDTTQVLLDVAWLEEYEWPRAEFVDWTKHWRLVIATVLGDEEQVVQLLGDAPNWWSFGWYDRVRLELDPLRDRADFQEFLRPKG